MLEKAILSDKRKVLCIVWTTKKKGSNNLDHVVMRAVTLESKVPLEGATAS